MLFIEYNCDYLTLNFDETITQPLCHTQMWQQAIEDTKGKYISIWTQKDVYFSTDEKQYTLNLDDLIFSSDVLPPTYLKAFLPSVYPDRKLYTTPNTQVLTLPRNI